MTSITSVYRQSDDGSLWSFEYRERMAPYGDDLSFLSERDAEYGGFSFSFAPGASGDAQFLHSGTLGDQAYGPSAGYTGVYGGDAYLPAGSIEEDCVAMAEALRSAVLSLIAERCIGTERA